MSEKEKLTSEGYIEKALSEMLKEEMDKVPEVHIDPDELKALAEEDKARRRKRFMKYASVAAVFALVCVTVLFTMWPGSAVPADADKNADIQTGKAGDVAIISEGDVQGTSGITTTVENDWNKLNKLKQEQISLYAPQYIPEGYDFKEVELKEYEIDVYRLLYTFENEKKESLIVMQKNFTGNSLASSLIKGENIQYMDTAVGQACISLDENNKISTGAIIIEDQLFRVQGPITVKQVIKIFENLQLI